jgi:hypothetical protein
MSNEQFAAYLLSIVDNLNNAIDLTMENMPTTAGVVVGNDNDLFNPRKIIYPALDPILKVKENLYEQIEALRGK